MPETLWSLFISNENRQFVGEFLVNLRIFIRVVFVKVLDLCEF